MKTYAQWCLIIVLIGSHYTEETSDIRRPPKIIKSPKREETFRERDSITLDCKAEGIPEVTYVWQKDGSDLNLNIARYTKAADGTITIEGLTKDDEGFYQCMARNQYGSAMSDLTQLRMAFIRTKRGPDVKTINVIEGQPFDLVNRPPNSFPRPTFSWETATSTNDPNPRTLTLSRRIQMDEDGNLHFACAKREDKLIRRIYKSTSFNAITDERRANNFAMVEITQGNVTNLAPQLGFSSENETIALVGKPLTLRCFFNGCPEPEVSWEYPSTGSQVGGRLSFPSGKFNTELMINSVNKIDEGNYTCIGSNSRGQMSHNINVRVEAEPKFSKESDAPRDINITEGENVTINCTAEAKPEANVSWFRNGQRLSRQALPPKFRLTNGGKSLMIRDVCRDCHDPDLAVIQCNASNVHGYVFASGYINVLKRTELTISSKSRDLNVSVEIGKENVFEFSCTVQYDPSTVVQQEWHKRTEKGYTVRLPSEAYPNATLDGNNLTIRFTSNLNDAKWQIYLGEYFCVGNNKYSIDSKSVFVSYDGPVPEPPIPENSFLTYVAAIAAMSLQQDHCCLPLLSSQVEPRPATITDNTDEPAYDGLYSGCRGKRQEHSAIHNCPTCQENAGKG